MSFGFNSSAPKPAGGSGFGGFASSGTPAFSGSSPFGGGGGFGASSTPTFGSSTGTSGFGSTTGGFGTQGTTGFGNTQQQSGGVFGGNSGFGSAQRPATTGFGTTSTFGSNPSQSPFGTPSTTTGTSPFGQTGSSVFGGSGNQTGFGAATGGFGSTTQSSTGGMFSGFGSAAKTPFGGNTTGGGFGSTSSFGGFGSGGQVASSNQVGTGSPAYTPTRETDGVPGSSSSTYISISRMAAYSNKSTEELRFEDYLKRSNPTAAQAQAAQYPASASSISTSGFGSGGFGTSTPSFGSGTNTGFGSATTQSGGFGSNTSTVGGFGGGFGTQQNSTGGSVFGNARQTTSGFGATPATQGSSSAFGTQSTGGFGSTPQTGGFGSTTAGGFGSGFGANSTNRSSFGGFGSTPASSGSATGGFGNSGFGQTGQSTGFGGFNSGTGASTFGGNTQQSSAPFGSGGQTSGSFGFANAPKPASGSGFGSFGSSATTSGGFGSTTSGFGTASGGLGSGTGGFGSTSGGFGSNTGAFGANTGGFGSSTGGFGSTPGTVGSGTAGFGSGSGGFGSSTGGFGSTSGGFGTSSGTGGFGASTGGFGTGNSGFGSTPSTSNSTGSTFFSGGGFGATSAKPAESGFGAKTGSSGTSFFGGGGGTSGSIFNSTSGFGKSQTGTGTGGFGTSTGSIGGGFGSTLGGFGTTINSTTPGFSLAPQTAQGNTSQVVNYVAAPDVNPYGTGSFGAGLVEQNVKAALESQTLKVVSKPASARFSTLTKDIGLPKSTLDSTTPAPPRRQLIGGFRHSTPVSFIRSSSFKGSKNRLGSLNTSTDIVLSTSSNNKNDQPSSGSNTEKQDFKFSSSLFRNSNTKKLVIDKTNHNGEKQLQQTTTSTENDTASVIPWVDDDAKKSSHVTMKYLKPDKDGFYDIRFQNLTNGKQFSVQLSANTTVKDAREEVKQHMQRSISPSDRKPADIDFVWKGRLLHDTSNIGDVQMKEGDAIDVIVLTGSPRGAPITNTPHTTQSTVTDISLLKTQNRFISYEDFLNYTHGNNADKEDDAENDSTAVDPCCPKLQKPNYYTIPSYASLKLKTANELAQVEGFTVGCKGLGSVEWLGKTDVRNLDLDELVHFEKKEVVVFQDDSNKHELGTGLNRPAIVTLQGIFRPAKSTVSEKQYRDRVIHRTEDIGATFLNYDAIKGVWQFRVEHFSRYGYDDNEDDETSSVEVGRASITVVENSRNLSRNRIPRQIAVNNSDRKELFKQSLLCKKSETTTSFRDSSITFEQNDDKAAQQGDIMLDYGMEDDVTDSEKSPQADSNVSIGWPISNMQKFIPSSLSMSHQIIHSLGTSSSHIHADLGLFLGRSFRSSWGPNGELLTLGRPYLSAESHEVSSDNQVNIEHPLHLNDPNTKKIVQSRLEMHYKCCIKNTSKYDESEDIVLQEFELPTDKGCMETIHTYVEFSQSIYNENPVLPNLNNLLLWKLLQALWGQEKESVHKVSQSQQQAQILATHDDINDLVETFQLVDLRHEAISQWFEEAVQLLECSSKNSISIVDLLSQHRIVEATESAMASGNFRLATLIAQSTSYDSELYQGMLADQLSKWDDSGALACMEKDMISVYSLLSGSVEVVTPQQSIVHNGSSWIMCLALFFWYKQGSGLPLKAAIMHYLDAVSKNFAAPPQSQYMKNKRDIFMDVMLLYTDDAVSLCDVLSPSGFRIPLTDEGSLCRHLNYELSWHLHSMVRALGYRLNRKWESHIHQNFIRQLESLELWEEAIYVAFNISDAWERECTCRHLLLRHADKFGDDSDMERMAIRLRIPVHWVHEALAILAIYNGDVENQFSYWMAAEEYEAAHLCFIQQMAPNYLFNGSNITVLQILHELEAVSAFISQWDACPTMDTIGGGLLLEYLNIEEREDESNITQLLHRILTLSERLSLAQASDPNHLKMKNAHEQQMAILSSTVIASMVTSLSSRAVEMKAALSSSAILSENPPLQPEFLQKLSHVPKKQPTIYFESYRTKQLTSLCSEFLACRS